MLKKIAIRVLFGVIGLVIVINVVMTIGVRIAIEDVMARQYEIEQVHADLAIKLNQEREVLEKLIDWQYTIRDDFDALAAQFERDRRVLERDRETIRQDRVKTLDIVDERLTDFESGVSDTVLDIFDRQADRIRDNLTEMQAPLVNNIAALDESLWMAHENAIALERAICESDYWLTSTRTMAWRTLDYLAGGETTVEKAQGFWDGVAVADDWANVSYVCAVGPDGAWMLDPNIMRITEDVQNR